MKYKTHDRNGCLTKAGCIADINLSASRYLGFPVTMAGISSYRKEELERMVVMYRFMAELIETANTIEKQNSFTDNDVLMWHIAKEEDRPQWVRDADLARWKAMRIWHDWRGCEKAHWNPYKESGNGGKSGDR